MALKRPFDASETGPEAKKQKRGFRVGPANLPDGPWRRKVTQIKKELIYKAKVKKEYAKIKAREDKVPTPDHGDEGTSTQEVPEARDVSPLEEETAETMHPTRELMLKDEEVAQNSAAAGQFSSSDGSRRRTRRPGYYDKQLKKAEERRKEAEERHAQYRQRQEEREKKIAERARFKRALAKTVGRDGKKKLGRESTILLDKVKKMMADK